MRLFALALSVAVLASCAKENRIDKSAADGPSEQVVKLYASLPSGMVETTPEELESNSAQPAGKSYIDINGASGGEYIVKWSSTDDINVNGATITNPELSDEGLIATFSGEGLEGPYRAIHPASMYIANSFVREVASGEGDSITHTGYKSADGNYYDYLKVNVPPTQTYRSGTYDPSSALIVASSNSANLSFKHLCAYLKLIITSDANIRRITLRNGNLSSGISGSYYLVFKGNGQVSIAAEKALQNITYDCGEDGVASGTPLIIALPPREFNQGLIITAEDVNGKVHSIKSTALNLNNHRGAMISVNMVFNANKGEVGKIYSANDWELFATDVNASRNLDRWIVNGKVEIVADITTSASLSRITNDWIYELDGKEHTITQNAAKGPLFMDINGGTVKNLTMRGEMTDDTITDTSNPGFCTIAREVKGNGTISGITNYVNFSASSPDNHYAFGPICRQIRYGSILNCTNLGNINLSIENPTNAAANVYGSGIVAIVGTLTSEPDMAFLDGSVVISGCHNEGAINLAYTSWAATKPIHYNSIGGIVAWVCGGDSEKYLTIENCSNTGSLTFTWPITNIMISSAYAGGIIGVAYLPGSTSASTRTLTTEKKPATWPTGRTLACAYGDEKNQLSATNTTPQDYVDGVYFEMKDCTNSGELALISPCSADSRIIRTKQYAGGLCGVAIGMLYHHAKISGTGVATCCNTGIVNGGSDYPRSSYQSVNGGLIGLAGHVDLEGVYAGTESSAVKVGKEYKTYANGGMIGLLMSQCNANACFVNADIIEANEATSMKFAGALVGAIKANGLNRTDSNYYKGCKFTNCKVKGTIYIGTELTGGTTTTLSSSNATANLLCDNDEVTNVSGDYDFTGTGYWE